MTGKEPGRFIVHEADLKVTPLPGHGLLQPLILGTGNPPAAELYDHRRVSGPGEERVQTTALPSLIEPAVERVA